MKRVTHAIPDASGTYKDSSNNRYILTSGMYSDSEIASMAHVWSPEPSDSGVLRGPQASPSKTVGVCYWNIAQSIEWLGLSNS